MTEMTLLATDTIAEPVARLVKRVRLSRGTEVTLTDDGEARLTRNGTTAGIGRPSAWTSKVLRRLQSESLPEDELQSQALAAGGPAGLFRWVENLRRLDSTGMVERSLTLAGELVSSVRPMGTGPSDKPPAFDPTARQRLSRFTVIQVVDGALVAGHPASHLSVELGPAAVEMLAHLRDWISWEEIGKSVSALPGSAIRAVLDHLARAAAIEQTNAAGGSEPEGSAIQWNSFDWWLHSRSRNQRVVAGWGATYPGRDRFDKLDPIPEPYLGPTLELPVPDLSEVARSGSALVTVMERRRSLRKHDDEHPMNVVQLGEFLYRTARTRGLVPTADGVDVLLDRPYPAGGSVHELETYVLVRHCDGVAAGLWHYQGREHRLVRVAELDGPTQDMLTAGQTAALMDTPPQLMLIVAARFGRLMWKYETIAYALILKHVGVLLNNFYLVATDMGLAPTAIGSGDALSFAEATGRDRMAEGSVGEFVLGSLPAGHTPQYMTQWGA